MEQKYNLNDAPQKTHRTKCKFCVARNMYLMEMGFISNGTQIIRFPMQCTIFTGWFHVSRPNAFVYEEINVKTKGLQTAENLVRKYVRLSMYCSTALCCDIGRFFSFLIFYTVGRTPLTGDQPVVRPQPTYRTAQTQNKRTQISVPWVGLEPTIPVFERGKTFHALDRAATVIGRNKYMHNVK
jgi:hypothetical protein